MTDPGKDLGYHWRRSAGVYDEPDHKGPPGNAHTLSTDLGGTEPAQPAKASAKKTAKK
jgi:hypothetical protein